MDSQVPEVSETELAPTEAEDVSDRAAIWDAVHQARRRLVQDLEGIADEQWQAPSLCPGWSVHDVLAHLIDSATTTRLGFLWQMVSSRLDFDRQRRRCAAPSKQRPAGDAGSVPCCDRSHRLTTCIPGDPSGGGLRPW